MFIRVCVYMFTFNKLLKKSTTTAETETEKAVHLRVIHLPMI